MMVTIGRDDAADRRPMVRGVEVRTAELTATITESDGRLVVEVAACAGITATVEVARISKDGAQRVVITPTAAKA